MKISDNYRQFAKTFKTALAHINRTNSGKKKSKQIMYFTWCLDDLLKVPVRKLKFFIPPWILGKDGYSHLFSNKPELHVINAKISALKDMLQTALLENNDTFSIYEKTVLSLCKDAIEFYEKEMLHEEFFKGYIDVAIGKAKFIDKNT